MEADAGHADDAGATCEVEQGDDSLERGAIETHTGAVW